MNDQYFWWDAETNTIDGAIDQLGDWDAELANLRHSYHMLIDLPSLVVAIDTEDDEWLVMWRT